MELEPTKIDAVLALKPNAEFAYRDDALVWLDKSQTQPTDSEITAKLAELKSATEYKINRAAEYPSVVDQLDEIYHNGIDAWKATIKATKDKYPKP